MAFVHVHGTCLSLGDALTNVFSLHVLVYIQSAYTYSSVEVGYLLKEEQGSLLSGL